MEAYLEGVLVALVGAELAHDAVELVLLDGLPFFGPFADGDDGAALGEYEAQQPPSQRVASSAALVVGSCSADGNGTSEFGCHKFGRRGGKMPRLRGEGAAEPAGQRHSFSSRSFASE